MTIIESKSIIPLGALLRLVFQLHGSQVAGAAAADLGDGGIVGVAPGASLHISDWDHYSGYADSTAKMAAATADASSAVVQNNSWAYPNTDAVDFESYKTDNSTYHEAWVGIASDVSSTTSTESYVTALDNFQSHGVIVFANGNNAAESAPSFSLLYHCFSVSWVKLSLPSQISKSGTSTFSYTNMGNPCGNAAAFCMAADGTNVTPRSCRPNRWHVVS